MSIETDQPGSATAVGPHTLPAPDALAALRWRYAVKEFDARRKIPQTDWEVLERALVLSPSSYGLQPWRFLVIEKPELRTRLLAASMNQRKVVDSSHLVVFAARTDVLEVDVNRWIERIAEVRHRPKAELEGLRASMIGDLVIGKRHQFAGEWAKRQVYLALGVFLTTAAVMGIDACPMEGFNPAAYDEILDLPQLGLAAAVIATAGYRSPHDAEASQPKVRFALDDVVVRL